MGVHERDLVKFLYEKQETKSRIEFYCQKPLKRGQFDVSKSSTAKKIVDRGMRAIKCLLV